MGKIMQELDISYGDYRDADLLIDEIRDRNLSHVVLVTNTQWAGRTWSTCEPRHLADLLARGIGSPYVRTGVRVVLEVDSGVHPLSPWMRSPLTLPDRPDVTRLDVRSLSPVHRTALQALALAEPRRVSFAEWSALCSVLGAELGISDLQTMAVELEWISVSGDGELPVGLAYASDAHRLRSDIPAEDFRAFQNAVVDQLFACSDADALTDYLARALPAHAAMAGRYEELLSTPNTLAKCLHPALVEALPVAFPNGVPAGTFAADLHYLDKLGVAPSSHSEWLSILHLLALSQGDPERARALTASAGPLPWRTVWSNWRAPGRLHTCGPHVDVIEELRADTDSTVTSLSANGAELRWDINTGLPLAGPDRQHVADARTSPDSPTPQPVWQAEPSRNLLRLQLRADPGVLRTVPAPKVQDAACVGNRVVVGGDRGLYAVDVSSDVTEIGPPLRALPAVGPRGKISPRPFNAAACRPTRARVRDIFSAETSPVLTEEQLPSGLTHEPTRRFLTEVGSPAVSGFYSLNTHNLLGTGLVERTWEGARNFETPVGDGPFYDLGTWIGGVLLLDGATGRVLRQTRPGAIDDEDPGEPLAGSSLASFVAMVCLQWEYMLAYTTSGGLDSEDLLTELTEWIAALDPAAAATQNWGHVLDPDNLAYL
ncbi:SUKH-4 family immunity protein [Streptomyces sp. V3I7]|uniref:SUKH-4 family immunity protein n=1 Tax=Streptomyces sp. V3I7 TaxID=3042278 RepID=UPI0027873BE6|nr:SUKH-4 family immunity protein [Streptomyces sp. V3I7]MDQ0993409.1 hypothetical protein [Streptomyces sp. V3I7]